MVDLTSRGCFAPQSPNHLSSKDSILFEQGDFRTSSRSAKGWNTTASSAARVLKKKLRSREPTSASGMR